MVNAIIVVRTLAYSRLEMLSQVQNGSTEDSEDQRQTHGRLNYSSTIVNSFNVHNMTMEDCYNNIPVTRSSFFCPHIT